MEDVDNTSSQQEPKKYTFKQFGNIKHFIAHVKEHLIKNIYVQVLYDVKNLELLGGVQRDFENFIKQRINEYMTDREINQELAEMDVYQQNYIVLLSVFIKLLWWQSIFNSIDDTNTLVEVMKIKEEQHKTTKDDVIKTLNEKYGRDKRKRHKNDKFMHNTISQIISHSRIVYEMLDDVKKAIIINKGGALKLYNQLSRQEPKVVALVDNPASDLKHNKQNPNERTFKNISLTEFFQFIARALQKPQEELKKYEEILQMNWYVSVDSMKNIEVGVQDYWEFPRRLTEEIQWIINNPMEMIETVQKMQQEAMMNISYDYTPKVFNQQFLHETKTESIQDEINKSSNNSDSLDMTKVNIESQNASKDPSLSCSESRYDFQEMENGETTYQTSNGSQTIFWEEKRYVNQRNGFKEQNGERVEYDPQNPSIKNKANFQTKKKKTYHKSLND